MSDYLRQRTRERRQQFTTAQSQTTGKTARRKAESPLLIVETPEKTVFTIAPRTTGGFLGLFKRTIGPAESVTVTRTNLTLTVGNQKPREFAFGKIYNLRVLVTEGGNSNRAPGEVKFEFGDETVSFGAGLEKSDAKRILNIIRERMMAYFA